MDESPGCLRLPDRRPQGETHLIGSAHSPCPHEEVIRSGALAANGRIEGSDNDADPRAYEPHHEAMASASGIAMARDTASLDVP